MRENNKINVALTPVGHPTSSVYCLTSTVAFPGTTVVFIGRVKERRASRYLSMPALEREIINIPIC
jgi:hypothetical protein